MSDTPLAAVDRTERAGSPLLVLVIAVLLVAAAASYSFLPEDQAGRLVLAFLAILAIIGLIALFFFAVGFLQFSGQAARNDITKLIADTNAEGLLVTEGETRVLYANEAYMAMSGAPDVAHLRPVERLFSGPAEISEAVYRLAQAARDHKRAMEEIRLSPALDGETAVGWYRVKVRPIERNGLKRATLWSVADVTRERERHENVFQELQHAIDFLDHAPAGFFSADAEGRLSYLNATLADWLDYDLAQVGSGGLNLSDIMAGRWRHHADGRHRDARATSGRSSSTSISSGATARACRCACCTAWRLRRTGCPELRARWSSIGRRARSLPRICAPPRCDSRGSSTRPRWPSRRSTGPATSCARTPPSSACSASALRGQGETSRSIYAGVQESDRAALQGAVAAAARGKGDIPPVDAMLSGADDRSVRLFVSARRSPRQRACRRQRLRARHDRAAHPAGKLRPGAEDAGHRPAGRRRRA